MNKTFVRTNNVKNFIGLVENLVNKLETLAKENNLTEINMEVIRQII